MSITRSWWSYGRDQGGNEVEQAIIKLDCAKSVQTVRLGQSFSDNGGLEVKGPWLY